MSPEKMAFIEWLNTFIVGSKFMGDSAANDYPNCRHIMRHAYSSDAMLFPWEGGGWGTPYNASEPAYPGAPFGALPYWDCMFFGSVEHYEWARGVYAVDKLEYCERPRPRLPPSRVRDFSHEPSPRPATTPPRAKRPMLVPRVAHACV